MSRGVDFLVATPGRLLDLMGQGFMNLDSVEAFVLDEADRMLDMGFIRDIRKVIAQLPDKRHSLFFSATFSKEIVSLADTMLDKPARVTIAPEKPTVERIDQKVMFVNRDKKDALLVSLLKDSRVDKVIVFTQQKHAANKVADRLERSGIRACTSRAPNSVNIGLGLHRKMIINHMSHTIHIDTAGCDISCDEHSNFPDLKSF